MRRGTVVQLNNCGKWQLAADLRTDMAGSALSKNLFLDDEDITDVW